MWYRASNATKYSYVYEVLGYVIKIVGSRRRSFWVSGIDKKKLEDVALGLIDCGYREQQKEELNEMAIGVKLKREELFGDVLQG